MAHVFISYAREDSATANRLYNDITAAGYSVWLDTKVLRPGQRWKPAVTTAIQESAAFLALISRSTEGRGYVQKELKEALDVLAEVPANQVFIIPARLEDVRPGIPDLAELTWVDLFPEYRDGLERILDGFATIRALDKRAAARRNPTKQR
jgi:hypothetical protein